MNPIRRWKCWDTMHKPRAYHSDTFMPDHVLLRCACGKNRWLLRMEPLRGVRIERL